MHNDATWEPLRESYDANDNGKLDNRERRALPDSAFAFPTFRELPLVDAEYTRAAADRLKKIPGATAEQRQIAEANIRAAAEFYGVEIDTPRHT